MDSNISFTSPFSGDRERGPTAYLVDAASGFGRVFGGHAFLLIEGVVDKVYILERIEIFATLSSAASGLVSCIKHRSVSVNMTNRNTDLSEAKSLNPIPEDPEEKKKFTDNINKITGKSKNYVSYPINLDQFNTLRRNVRIKQINYARNFAEAMVIVEDILPGQLDEKLNKEHVEAIAKWAPKYREDVSPNGAFFWFSRGVAHHLATDTAKLKSKDDFSTLNQKHAIAVRYLNLVSDKAFLKGTENGSSSSAAVGLLISLLFTIEKMTNPDTKTSYLPQSFPRFRLSGPEDNFRGSVADDSPVNCLAWAKSLIEDLNIGAVETNKPKKLGGPSCTIQ